MVYDKPFKTYTEQVNLFQSRGLTVADHEDAVLTLQQINYYRFSAHALPFQKIKDVFNMERFIHVPVELLAGMGFPEDYNSLPLWNEP